MSDPCAEERAEVELWEGVVALAEEEVQNANLVLEAAQETLFAKQEALAECESQEQQIQSPTNPSRDLENLLLKGIRRRVKILLNLRKGV